MHDRPRPCRYHSPEEVMADPKLLGPPPPRSRSSQKATLLSAEDLQAPLRPVRPLPGHVAAVLLLVCEQACSDA
jgi:hypothetical protein